MAKSVHVLVLTGAQPRRGRHPARRPAGRARWPRCSAYFPTPRTCQPQVSGSAYNVTPGSLTSWSVQRRRRIHRNAAPISTSRSPIGRTPWHLAVDSPRDDH